MGGMKLLRFLTSLLAMSVALQSLPGRAADLGPFTPLWPKTVPGETGGLGEEKDMTSAKDGKIAGRALIRLGNVSTPGFSVHLPPKDKNTGAAVVVCPGGGYNILALDLEGSEVCEWLNSIGVTGILLKYRVPRRKGVEKHTPPLQDLQRAISTVRARAGEWGIDPQKIGVLGFSAGGHLVATASTQFDKRAYEPQDETDKVSCRPDFAVLVYPAYLTVKEQGDKLSPELTVTPNTPPSFLVQTQDDGVRVESSLFYYLALKNAKVPAELHLYPKGGHGYGLRATELPVTAWPKRAEEWLRSQGWLTVKQP
ncbi:xylanase [Verrucomicrobiota bacterium]|nr:xylanase [Verrucomicrobiota bacterium]